MEHKKTGERQTMTKQILISDIIIKPEYYELVPRMMIKEEKESFRQSAHDYGIREPLQLNKDNILLDGHSRLDEAKHFLGKIDELKEKIQKQKHAHKTKLESMESNTLERDMLIKDFEKTQQPLLDELTLLESHDFKHLPYEIKRFDNDLLEKKYVIECNLQRRHLTKLQRVQLGKPLLDIERELAKQRKLKTLKQNQPLGSNDPNGEETEEDKGKAIEKVAKKVGVSSTTMMRGMKVLNEAPKHLVEKGLTGKTSVNSIYNIITRKERNLPKVELPVGKWSICFMDLPIQFDDEGVRGSSSNNYDTIPIPDLKLGIFNGKDVRELFDTNCVMFAWFQASTIFYAKEILGSWGFKCVTNQVWRKKRLGTGSWLANKHEHLVIAVKGDMPLPVERLDSVVEVEQENRTHSSKPKFFYDQIEKAYPNRKYLDLFSRYQHNENWTCFGNQLKEAIKEDVTDIEKEVD